MQDMYRTSPARQVSQCPASTVCSRADLDYRVQVLTCQIVAIMMFRDVFVPGLPKRAAKLRIVRQTLHRLGKLVGAFRLYAYLFPLCAGDLSEMDPSISLR